MVHRRWNISQVILVKKYAIMASAATRVDLDITILGEVSQKKKVIK